MAQFEVGEIRPDDICTFQVRSFSRDQKVMDFLSSQGVSIAPPEPIGLASTVTNGTQMGLTSRQEAINNYKVPRVVKDLFVVLAQNMRQEFGPRKDYGAPEIQERMVSLFDGYKASHPELPFIEESTDGNPTL